MNQKTTYEITITEKLEQLKAPQLVDSIWARIEAQLDLELPTDDGPPNPPASPLTGPGKWIGGGILALLLFLFFFQNKEQTPASVNEPLIETPTINNGTGQPKQPPGNSTIANPQNNASSSNSGDPLLTVPDSGNTTSVPNFVPQPDSSAGTPLLLNVPKQQLPPPKTNGPDSTKKRRGVQGITNDDYRIVPKKDSTERSS